MDQKRQQLVQESIEKMTGVLHMLNSSSGFPFNKCNLGRPHVIILFHLKKAQNGLSVKDLSHMLHVTSGATTQFLNDLSYKKLIKRTEDPKDRRTMKITLTQSAKNYFITFKKTYFKIINPLFNNLSNDELSHLLNLMEKIKIDTMYTH